MQINLMAEGPVTMMCTDHQGEDAQCRSCPLVVSTLPQEECLSARSQVSSLAVAGASSIPKSARRSSE